MNVNFTLRNMPRDIDKTKPSIFACSVLFFIGVTGLYILPVIMSFIQLIFGSFLISELTGMIESMYYIFFIVLPIIVYFKAHPSSCADVMRINPFSLKSALFSVIAALVCVYLSQIVTLIWSILIESVFGTSPASNFVIPTTASSLASSIFFVAVLPGICEELLFRGAILGAWEVRGTKTAIVISTIWFALMHGSIAGIPAQLLCGVVLAVIVVSTDSLFSGMIFHTVYNAVTLLLAFVANRQFPEARQDARSVLDSIGGVGGVIELIVPCAFFTVLLILVLKAIDTDRIRKKGRLFGYPPSKKRDLSLCEYMVIGAGFSIVFMNYLEDLLEIMGWI